MNKGKTMKQITFQRTKLSSETFTELYLLWKDANVVLKKLHSTFQRYPMYVTFSFTSETSESASPILREKNAKHEEKCTSCTSPTKLDWKELNANTMLRYTTRIPSQMIPFIRTTCSSRKQHPSTEATVFNDPPPPNCIKKNDYVSLP